VKAKIISLLPAVHEQAMHAAAKVVLEGGIIICPTDTIYGIGADATNEKAVRRIYSIKGRDDSKPMLVLADSIAMADTYAFGVSSTDWPARYWPGPITFVFKARNSIPAVVTGERGTIGIRVPQHKFCLDLVKAIGKPIISTSANLSGMNGGDRIDEIERQFADSVDMIINAGNVHDVLPSTIVDVTGKTPKILRQGAISITIE
jgi:L-threonylcarbamoyladenylate synthase